MTVDLNELRRLERLAFYTGTRGDADVLAYAYACRNALPELLDALATWERATNYWKDNYERERLILAVANDEIEKLRAKVEALQDHALEVGERSE